MPFPEFSVFVATKCHCSFSTCHGSCGWLKLLEDTDGTCINVDYENIYRFGLWEHALSGFFCWLSGSTHDARILRKSTLYQGAEQGHKLTGPVVDVDGDEIDPYALGYSAHPISPWPQKPFPESTKEWSEIQFNRELSSARVKVESAFDRLKSQWRIVQKKLDSDIALSAKSPLPVVHNSVSKWETIWDDDWNPDHHDCHHDNEDVVRDNDKIRDILSWLLKHSIAMTHGSMR